MVSKKMGGNKLLKGEARLGQSSQGLGQYQPYATPLSKLSSEQCACKRSIWTLTADHPEGYSTDENVDKTKKEGNWYFRQISEGEVCTQSLRRQSSVDLDRWKALALYGVFPVPLVFFRWRIWGERAGSFAWTTWPETLWPRGKTRQGMLFNLVTLRSLHGWNWAKVLPQSTQA